MIASALRALRILESVGRSERAMGVAELAREHGLSSGTAFRSLDALEQSGYVAKYQLSARYVLGPAVHQLRQSLLARFRLRDASLPYLHQLAFASGETVSLTVPVGWYGLLLAAAQGMNEVTSSPQVGSVHHLEQSCAGLALLAFSGDKSVEAYLAWRSGDDAAINEGRLRQQVRETRDRGFAVEVHEYAQDRAVVAFPVHGLTTPIAAITIEGPAFQTDPNVSRETLKKWLGILQPLQKLVTSRAGDFINPFGHLDPSSIKLAT